MIRVYNSDEKKFANNGLKILKPNSCIVYKEDNGDYYIEVEDNIDNYQYYQANMIITCPTPFPEGVQAFRIVDYEIKQQKVLVTAKHVYFDCANYIIADNYIVEKDCNYALDHLNTNCDKKTPFKTSSDITLLNTYRCIRKSLEEAISVLIERWGGHIIRDNFNIQINSSIGEDRGVTLKYAKNITEMKTSENWDNVCTKVLPVGKDGILLPEVYIESNENLYDIPFTKVITFEQNINVEDFDATDMYENALIEDLRNQAKEFLLQHRFPEVNYSLSAHLDKITDVGDTIYVEHPKIGVALTTNVISVKWDVLLKRYKNIEFGNFKNSLKNLIKDMSSQSEKIAKTVSNDTKVLLEEELEDATNKILGMMGNSYVIYDGDKILVVDSLPQETATNVIMINSGGIGFSNTGINGEFKSAWTIDGTLDMQNINVINLVADMIKGGTLKLGGLNNNNGVIEIYNSDSVKIGTIDNNGLDMSITNVAGLKNELITIDVNGIHVATDLSAIETIMTNDTFAIKSGDTVLAYFGYDSELQTTVAKMNNLTVEDYFVSGYHRAEKFDIDSEHRTGVFYVGGSI